MSKKSIHYGRNASGWGAIPTGAVAGGVYESVDEIITIWMKYLKSFLIILIIYPFLSWIFDLVFEQEQQVCHYILSGVLVGTLFIIMLYFLDRNTKKRRKNSSF